jgi:hypothetical protein
MTPHSKAPIEDIFQFLLSFLREFASSKSTNGISGPRNGAQSGPDQLTGGDSIASWHNRSRTRPEKVNAVVKFWDTVCEMRRQLIDIHGYTKCLVKTAAAAQGCVHCENKCAGSDCCKCRTPGSELEQLWSGSCSSGKVWPIVFVMKSDGCPASEEVLLRRTKGLAGRGQ